MTKKRISFYPKLLFNSSTNKYVLSMDYELFDMDKTTIIMKINNTTYETDFEAYNDLTKGNIKYELNDLSEFKKDDFLFYYLIENKEIYITRLDYYNIKDYNESFYDINNLKNSFISDYNDWSVA
ncbi:MAG: hypothetical protein RR646_06945 [Erysipelotrichaceae bacterium]